MNRLAAVLLTATLCASASAHDLLKPADVEAATGIKGVAEVPKDTSKGAGGAINFAGPDGKLVMIVMLEPMSTLSTWKKRYGKCEPMPDLGPDGCAANVDPVFGFMTGYVYFSKNNRAVWLQQMGNKPGNVKKPNIERPELLKLARLVASRL